MAFTAGEITNIANSALDYYFGRGEAFKQSLQKRPLWDMFERKRYTWDILDEKNYILGYVFDLKLYQGYP